MGGAAPTPTGKGNKKPLDAQINLVPFIDLLSCCISFLLITAVWTQLARMDVTQKGQGAAGSQDEKTPIPLKGDDYDWTKLADILKEAKTAYPDKTDLAVKSDDAVIYKKVVHS